MTASPDTRLLATGFSDSLIRLHHLALLGKQRVRLRERAEKRALGGGGGKKQKVAGGGGGGMMEVDWEEDELQEELEDLSQQQVTNLIGHSGPVNALSFSADQQLLFSASTDSTVRLWSTELRRGLAAYRGHVYPVWDVAACPHGTYFVSGGSDRTARLWSTEHIRPLRIFAAGAEDGTVAVYDLASARRLALLEGHKGPVWSVSYSRGGGSLLATGQPSNC
eukprot:gene3881-4136_t